MFSIVHCCLSPAFDGDAKRPGICGSLPLREEATRYVGRFDEVAKMYEIPIIVIFQASREVLMLLHSLLFVEETWLHALGPGEWEG